MLVVQLKLKKKSQTTMLHYKNFLNETLSNHLLRVLAFHKLLKPTLTPESDGLQGIGVDEVLQRQQNSEHLFLSETDPRLLEIAGKLHDVRKRSFYFFLCFLRRLKVYE